VGKARPRLTRSTRNQLIHLGRFFIMDKQILDMLNTRFDSLDHRFDVVDETSKEQTVLLHCIDKKVAVNASSITWMKWSLRGAWTSLVAVVGWTGFR